MASSNKPKRVRKVEQPGNPDQVSEAKVIEQQANIEAQREEELLANVRYVTAKEPPLGTIQGNFVLTANGWSQHADRDQSAIVADETELEEAEEDDESHDGDDQEQE